MTTKFDRLSKQLAQAKADHQDAKSQLLKLIDQDPYNQTAVFVMTQDIISIQVKIVAIQSKITQAK